MEYLLINILILSVLVIATYRIGYLFGNRKHGRKFDTLCKASFEQSKFLLICQESKGELPVHISRELTITARKLGEILKDAE